MLLRVLPCSVYLQHNLLIVHIILAYGNVLAWYNVTTENWLCVRVAAKGGHPLPVSQAASCGMHTTHDVFVSGN